MKKNFYFYFIIILLNSCTEDSITPKDELNNITNPPGNFIEKLLVNPDGNFFAATSEGLFKSTDEGTTWSSLTSSIDSLSHITDVLLTSDSYIFIIGYVVGSFYFYRSSDHGNSWVNINLQAYSSSSLEEDNWANIYLCSDGLKKSSDNGDTWEELYDGSVHQVYFPKDSLIIIGIPGLFSGQIAYSIDNGNSWNFTGHRLNAMAFYKHDSLLFAGGGFGHEGGGGAHKSTDNGISWELLDLYIPSVTSFNVNNQNLLFTGTSDGIYFTEDFGETWQSVLPDSFVTTLARNNRDYLYAGTSKGTLLRSTDNGMSWHN